MADLKSEELLDIFALLGELSQDTAVPRNVKQKIDATISILKDESLELPIRVDKSLAELDEIADDPNMQPFTRSQIWNIVSLLEKISH